MAMTFLMYKNHQTESKNTINILLGITFSSRLKWQEQVDSTIKAANTSAQAIIMIRKFFTQDEIKNMPTTIYFLILTMVMKYGTCQYWQNSFKKILNMYL